jgi:hypothetical protein
MRLCTLTNAALGGAAMMYLFDPDRGRARRARMRDQAAKLVRQSEHSLDVLGRDMSNRIYGTVAELTGLLACGPVDDETLVARVRSKLGRVSRHPSAIEVAARDGRVELSGHVLAEEVQCIVHCVSSVPGVAGVDNGLDVHQHASEADALMGGNQADNDRGFAAWRTWSPTARFCGLLGGLVLLGRGAALPLLIGGTAAVLSVSRNPPRRGPTPARQQSAPAELPSPVI